MARIGFAVAGAVIGAFFGPVGAQVGFALGGLVGSMLFPAKLPSGPRLNDLIVSTATDGAPIPFGYGIQRIAGNIIWAPPITENTVTKSAKGGPKQTSYNYTASFAVAFCEGVASPQRIWFDSKVVFDSRATLQTSGKFKGQYQFTSPITASTVIAGTTIQVTSALNPPVGSEVIIMNAPQGNGTFQVTSSSPTQFSYFNAAGVAPGSSGTAALPPIKYPAPTIYTGSELQNADPTIQAAVGAANCPAFRGICYAVYANFPLNDFGNRIPNIRAEIIYQTLVTKTGAFSFIDNAYQANVNTFSDTITLNNVTPSSTAEMIWAGAIFAGNSSSHSGVKPDNSWTAMSAVNGGQDIAFPDYGKILPTNTPFNLTLTSSSVGDNDASAAYAILFGVSGAVFPQLSGVGSGSGGSSVNSGSFSTQPGDIIVCFSESTPSQLTPLTGFGANDTQGNPYEVLVNAFGAQNVAGQFPHGAQIVIIVGSVPSNGGGNNNVVTFTGQNLGTWSIHRIRGVTAVTSLTATPTISNIIADICTRTGLAITDIDTSALAAGSGSPAVPTPAPLGYTISRPTTGQNALKPLAEAFFFDAVESGGVIRFIPRGLNAITSITIPETDLGLEKDKFKLTEQLEMAQELPREVQVLFQDKNLDYQQNKTHKRRATRIVKTKNQTVYELAMVLDPSVGRQIAEKALFLAYLERHPYDFNLWRPLYMLFDPTDVIQFTYNSLTFIARIVKQDIGVDYTCAISAVSENTNTYQSITPGSSGTGVTPAQAVSIPDTLLFLFDIPLLQDSDSGGQNPGIYFAMSSLDIKHWPGGSLQKSTDNVNFAQQASSNQACHFGTAVSVLPPPPNRGALGGSSPWVWDTVSTLKIVMQNGTLAGTSDINVLNGANALLVGSLSTGWELIQYANAVQNPDGSFTISRLLRGRRGTEGQTALHGANESVIDVVAAGVVRQQETTADLQVLRYYNPVSIGNLVDPTQSQQLQEQGNDLKPYAVTSVGSTRDSSGNLTITWIRRTRIGGDWLEGIGTVPLSEANESYDIDILSGPGGTVKRTLSVGFSDGFSSMFQSIPNALYTAAQQITDFGSTQSQVFVNIYQRSAIVGRGFPKSAAV